MATMHSRSLRVRFYVEVVLALAGLSLVAITLLWKEWIEIVFRVDPDAGNGSLEYLVCLALLAGVALSAWLARTEWRVVRSARVAPHAERGAP